MPHLGQGAFQLGGRQPLEARANGGGGGVGSRIV